MELQTIEDNQTPQPASVAFVTWKNLSVTVVKGSRAGNKILAEVNGYVEPKRMLALMGPSGSGKTTLLDTLAGRLASSASSTGKIYLNGKESDLSYGKTAYVTQDDVLTGTLTVRETINFSALLRLPPSLSYEHKQRLVDRTIKELGLEDAAHTFMGNWQEQKKTK
eukprot:TRINITY_DN31254_c0_g1_i4.p1 TRINITY_DN31254_c0_g1~~TRINITY_DN31254_c0_g1_i4.p1  ORF type:complete len:166 (-),score=23.14 TRINITY_DN31254_c0_g1_i4:23-520(-)